MTEPTQPPHASPDDEIVIGGPVERVKVSLRVVGADLDPAAVTALLGVEPTFAAARGERRTRHGRTVTQRTGVWSHALTATPSREWELGDAIDALLARFPADAAVWRRLAAMGTVDVFCGLFLGSDNQGAELAPATMGALRDRGLSLGLDICGTG